MQETHQGATLRRRCSSLTSPFTHDNSQQKLETRFGGAQLLATKLELERVRVQSFLQGDESRKRSDTHDDSQQKLKTRFGRAQLLATKLELERV
ncbi:hypothetical protein MMC29_004944, partial [Sticta canariensis]|nr:hypothetical protein [Sticta canariensis]